MRASRYFCHFLLHIKAPQGASKGSRFSTYRLVQIPGATSQSSANAINNSGQVVGWTQTLEELSQGGSHATFWNGANTTRLGSPDGFQSSAEDINDAGQIVGSDALTATLWNGTTATQLGSAFTSASAINSSGQVAGSYTLFSQDPFLQITVGAIVWNGSDAINLSDTSTYSWDEALAINDVGQVVGSSSFRAALWNDGSLIDLNSFLDERLVNDGWKLTEATGINDNGWIVGKALNEQSNLTHAFLLTPIPEAETYMMFIAGLGLLGFMARRRADL